MKLFVVESPAKKKTIQKYLGADFKVMATSGHFRDLPKRELGVDLTAFSPTYVLDPDKADYIAAVKTAAKSADAVYLATDADREGEAIAWHLVDELHLRGARRVRYIEITPKALTDAIAAATDLDQHLVDAQQARRVIDRLVGYQLSPLLSPFGSNHSAGRVQSATLHLVVARELEREAHVPTKYWTLAVKYTNGLLAKYLPPKSDSEEDARIHSEEEAQSILGRARGSHSVTSIETVPSQRRPKAPFVTSTLQRAAAAALKLKSTATMQAAQALFEAGLITYHRTDSVAVSDDAAAMARAYLQATYPEALPETRPVYKSKSSAQGAHECIRPTAVDIESPEGLQGDALGLYQLIRVRFLASQCRPADTAVTTITTTSGDTTWRAKGTTVVRESFLRFLRVPDEDDAKSADAAEPTLPSVAQGQVLEVEALSSVAQETKPPPRYTEASLVKAMESAGIGRPSTYDATMRLLPMREYVAEEKGFLAPTPRGRLIDGVLTAAFPALVATDYTAKLEETLDEVAEGKRSWSSEVRAWYGPWATQLAAAADLFRAEAARRPELATLAPDAPKPTGKPCPRCGKELFLRHGKKGAFLACTGFPDCDYTADPSARPSERKCPKCEGPMQELDGKFGPYARCLNRECKGLIDLKPPTDETCPVCAGPMRDKGDFLSCANYPTCRGSWDKKALAAAKKANRTCPKCKTRLLSNRKSPRGVFVGCSGYPACDYTEDSAPKASAAKKAAGGRR